MSQVFTRFVNGSWPTAVGDRRIMRGWPRLALGAEGPEQAVVPSATSQKPFGSV